MRRASITAERVRVFFGGVIVVHRQHDAIPKDRVGVTVAYVEVRIRERGTVLTAIAVDAEPVASIAEKCGVAGAGIGDARRDVVIVISGPAGWP